MCQVKPGSPEFHHQGRGRGNQSGPRAEGVTASPGSWRGSEAPTRPLDRCLTEQTTSLTEKQCQEQVIIPQAFTVRLKGRGIIRQQTGAWLTTEQWLCFF